MKRLGASAESRTFLAALAYQELWVIPNQTDFDFARGRGRGRYINAF